MANDDDEEVKSRAIVKFSVPKPAQFLKLKCNTDLNLPPSNWLSSSADPYGLQHVLYHQKGFSSFRMAHLFPDCVGEVDVVSDAENIKKLLKIPYSKGHISMMVHRVENTLLLDDFDIYKHPTSETDWKWLKKFFCENINRKIYEEDRIEFIKKRRRDALKQKSLVSKFLYHSLGEEVSAGELEVKTTLPILPRPQLPEPVSVTPGPSPLDHNYNRNVVWTFEDIEMLIGTDLPIFGGGTHPCISLRLRDVSKPINVLTGIDYWLDNLMSNVPEVVMCYHLNGIVQKYELIKTEDLPRLDNSRFSPQLIRDVAQNILSFLKSNATKAGHTYWLFKDKDEEVVKLYDLTSLCSEKDVENEQNPFTIPVGLLLYKVGYNMKNNKKIIGQRGTIRMLLKNCVKLLSEEKYPELVASSHFMLSDLYVPEDTNPENPGLETMEVDESCDEYLYDDDDDDDKTPVTKILVLDGKVQKDFVNQNKFPPPIHGTVEERCHAALQHITAGFSCLEHMRDELKPERKGREEEQVFANPNESIPMQYDTLGGVEVGKKKHGKKKKKKEKNQNALLPKHDNSQPPTEENIPWKDCLKKHLYKKAVLVYAILSEQNFGGRLYGSCLFTIPLLARCQIVLNNLFNVNILAEDCLLGRAGDCCVMIVQNWKSIESYREQFQTMTDADVKIMEQLEKDLQNLDINLGKMNIKSVFIYALLTIEQMLLQSVECYEAALRSSETDSVLRRLGNSLNEVASLYLNKAKSAEIGENRIEMCKKAEPFLIRGLIVFKKVKDQANTALLYSNMGHLHRLLAHANMPDLRGELTEKERTHYNKAIVNYKKALQVLAERQYCPAIWDLVTWDLSTALFNMGTIMHENPSPCLTKTEAEREVIEILQKALQYCDFDEQNPKFPLYQYRAALIHYRIGCLYHSHIWNTANDLSNRKIIIQLAKINYEKASKLYFVVCDVINYFTSQMQRVALSEYLAETANGTIMKIKHLKHCLSIFIEIKEMLKMLEDKKVDIPEDKEGDNGLKTCVGLLNLIKERLQHVLKIIIKVCLIKPPANKDCPKLAEIYKSCYKLTFSLKDVVKRDQLIAKLHDILSQIAVKLMDQEHFE